jgi:hypothetical protein
MHHISTMAIFARLCKLVFLSQTARKVYMLVRAARLAELMSRYLLTVPPIPAYAARKHAVQSIAEAM